MSVQAPTPSAALMSIMSATDAAMMAVQPCTSVDIYYAKSMTAHHEVSWLITEQLGLPDPPKHNLLSSQRHLQQKLVVYQRRRKQAPSLEGKAMLRKVLRFA